MTLNQVITLLFFSTIYIYIIFWRFYKIKPYITLFHEGVIIIILLLLLIYIFINIILQIF
jgi:hypothetical protein